jgi:hypothetical protein
MHRRRLRNVRKKNKQTKMPMAEKRGDGKTIVAASLADARRRLARRKKFDDPAPELARNGALPGKWTRDALGMPVESPCPVTPLGREGGLYHLMDSAGQFRSFEARDFSHAGIQDLFARAPHWPKWCSPRYGRAPKAEDGEAPKPPPIKSFEDDGIREMLMKACSDIGQFSADNKLRGRGAWALRGGGLIYHAGEELWRCDVREGVPFFRSEEPRMVEGHLYPLLPEIPAPWDQPMRADDNPAGDVLRTLRCWVWDKPDIDPVLVLGWIGIAFLGGALEWRSSIVLLGDKGTGKSTLQNALRDLFGDGLLKTGNTSAAGIRQVLRNDARPVDVDEMENEAETQRRIKEIIQMMRVAASGDRAFRGGADHKAVEFQLRSAFMLAAINNPVQSSQDLSRVAILRLQKLDDKQAMPPPIDADTCGRKLLARLMIEWPKFTPLYEAYAGALATGGHDARGQRTYGTLLACAEMLLGPDLAAELGVPLTEDLAFWSERLAADRLPEVEDSSANWRACLTHLLTVPTDLRRNGAQITVGKILADLRGGAGAAADGRGYDFGQAKDDLGLIGLGLLPAGDVATRDAGHVLAVPNASPALARLFEGTAWGGSPGAGGPWKDALRQAPAGNGIVITDKKLNRVWIAGVQQRCTLVVIERFHQAAER